MKSNFGNAILKDCKERGYILINGVYYPPNSAQALQYQSQTTHNTQKNKSRLKRIKTAWIDDTLNIKNRDSRIDPFVSLVKKELGLTVWPEFRFLLPPAPDYRFDYAIPIHTDNSLLMIAIEVQGGIWARGNSGHSSGTGITRDMDKASRAALAGWTLIQRVPTDLTTIDTLNMIRQAAALNCVLLP